MIDDDFFRLERLVYPSIAEYDRALSLIWSGTDLNSDFVSASYLSVSYADPIFYRRYLPIILKLLCTHRECLTASEFFWAFVNQPFLEFCREHAEDDTLVATLRIRRKLDTRWICPVLKEVRPEERLLCAKIVNSLFRFHKVEYWETELRRFKEMISISVMAT